MKINKKFIIAFSVYNSYQNLKSIFSEIKKSSYDYLIKRVIIIDNNSDKNFEEKISFIKNLSIKYKKKIQLIINKNNYGLGGSQKILFKNLKKEKFSYLINAHTTGRYKIVNQLKFINKKIEYDYIIGSRFLNNKNTKNYSIIRKIFNIFFIRVTNLTTGCKLSDPGSAIYIINKKLLLKIMPMTIRLTNYSHFNHLLNVLIYKKKPSIYEFSMRWKEGNIKSHLNPIKYVTVLLFSLINFYLNKNFYKKEISNFKFKKYAF